MDSRRRSVRRPASCSRVGCRGGGDRAASAARATFACEVAEHAALRVRIWPERRVAQLARLDDGIVSLPISTPARVRRCAEDELRRLWQRAVAWADGQPLILGGDLNLRSPSRTRRRDSPRRRARRRPCLRQPSGAWAARRRCSTGASACEALRLSCPITRRCAPAFDRSCRPRLSRRPATPAIPATAPQSVRCSSSASPYSPRGLVVALVEGVARDLRRRVLVAVGGVFDQFLLGQLEALGLATAGLLDGLALLAPARAQLEQRVGGHLVGHGANCTRSARSRTRLRRAKPIPGRGMLKGMPQARATTQTRGYTASKDELQRRLARIEGQVRGVSKMVAEERYCIDVLTQIAAIEAALDKVALGLLDDHARVCVLGAEEGEREQRAEEMMAAVGRLMRRG